MRQRHAAVLLAMRQQQRPARDGLGQMDRRDLPQRLALGLQVAHQARQAQAPGGVGDVVVDEPAALQVELKVGHRHPGHAAAPQLGLPRQSHQRGVAAVAGAGNAGLVAGQVLALRPAQHIGQIVLHGLTPLPQPGLPVPRAVAAAAAKLGLQHQIAARGEELRHAVPLPARAAHPGPAVHQHDGGPGPLARRLGDPHRQRQPVASHHALQTQAGHLRGVDGRLHPRQRAPLTTALLQQPELARVAVAPAVQQQHGVVGAAAPAVQAVDATGEARIDLLLQLAQRRQQPHAVLALALDAQPDQPSLVPQRRAHQVETGQRCQRVLRRGLAREIEARQHALAGGTARHADEQAAELVDELDVPRRLVGIALVEQAPVGLVGAAPVQAVAAGVLGQHDARHAAAVEPPAQHLALFGRRRHAGVARGAAARVQPQRVQAVLVPAADQHVLAVPARQGQQHMAQVERGLTPAGAHFHRLLRAALHQFARPAALARHAEQARPLACVSGTRHAEIADCEQQQLAADPVDARHVGVVELRQYPRPRLALAQVKQVERLARIARCGQEGQAAPVGAEARRLQARAGEEARQRRRLGSARGTASEEAKEEKERAQQQRAQLRAPGFHARSGSGSKAGHGARPRSGIRPRSRPGRRPSRRHGRRASGRRSRRHSRAASPRA